MTLETLRFWMPTDTGLAPPSAASRPRGATVMLEPNEDGTVCAVCRKPIVPNVDAVHGAYHGFEARHYACTSAARMPLSLEKFNKAYDRAKGALEKIRANIRDLDR
jgi:hypothetical protein